MCAYAAFACDDDISSKIGYIILLCDDNNNSHILDYFTKNSRRDVRSIMAGETISGMDGFDCLFVVCGNLNVLLGTIMPLHRFKDSKQIFDAITRGVVQQSNGILKPNPKREKTAKVPVIRNEGRTKRRSRRHYPRKESFGL